MTKKETDKQTSENLKAAVYGANDGLITTFAVVAGVTGAQLSAATILILGIANMVGDGISMGLSDYLGSRSQMQFWRSRSPRNTPTHPVWHTGMITFLAFVAAGTLPLIPYILSYINLNVTPNTFYASMIATGISMFTVGSLRTLITKGNWWRNGLEMLLVGALASSAAFGLGALVESII